MTSNMAPAHPHATPVAVYPALLRNEVQETEKASQVHEREREK